MPPLRQYGADGRSRHIFQLTLLFLDGALYFRYLACPFVHVLEDGHTELPVELGSDLLSIHVGDAGIKCVDLFHDPVILVVQLLPGEGLELLFRHGVLLQYSEASIMVRTRSYPSL